MKTGTFRKWQEETGLWKWKGRNQIGKKKEILERKTGRLSLEMENRIGKEIVENLVSIYRMAWKILTRVM